MDEILKMLDEKVECPKCKTVSFRAHAYYEKTFQDLPIQGKKVKIILRNRKMLCMNKDCETKTFAETFDFIKPKAKKTNRIIDILNSRESSENSKGIKSFLNIKIVSRDGSNEYAKAIKSAHPNVIQISYI